MTFGGEVVGHPVSWNQLLSTVFNPLTLKYLDHIRQDDDLTAALSYRTGFKARIL